jgi:hypothetical protein
VAAADCCLLGAWEAGTAVECGLLRTARAGGLVLPCRCSHAGTSEWRLRAAAAPYGLRPACLAVCRAAGGERSGGLSGSAPARLSAAAQCGARRPVLPCWPLGPGSWEEPPSRTGAWRLEVWRRSGGRQDAVGGGRPVSGGRPGRWELGLWGELRRGRVLAWAVSL